MHLLFILSVPHPTRLQKTALGALELQLQMIFNHYLGAGNRTWVRSKALNG